VAHTAIAVNPTQTRKIAIKNQGRKIAMKIAMESIAKALSTNVEKVNPTFISTYEIKLNNKLIQTQQQTHRS